MEIAKVLKNVYLFSQIEDEHLEQLASYCSIVRLKRNAELFNQGESAEAFFVIVYGKMSIYRVSREGEEQVLHIHSDRDVVAEAAIFDRKVYPASCRALKESVVIRVPKAQFMEMIESDSKLAIQVLSGYSKRLREFVSMVEYLSLDDVKLRVLKFFQKNMRKENGKMMVNLKLSKKEMALLLGMAPETLSRTLKSLKTSGIIREDEGTIYIENKDAFSELHE